MKAAAPRNIRIVQLLASLKYGDGIGNDCLAIYRTLKEAGYDTAIYSGNIDDRILERGLQDVKALDKYHDDADILICHIGYRWDYMRKLDRMRGKKILVWHNITPPDLLEEYGDFETASGCRIGLEQLREIKQMPSLCLTSSSYNKRDLEKLGYTCPIHIFPHLAEFSDETEEDFDRELFSRYTSDGCTNILFVGRIVPNKRQQDIIASFYHYHTFINSHSRLFIVGGGDEESAYCRAIKAYPHSLKLDSVIFTGHVSDRQKASYYRLADVFLCMSAHEGFCVPLLEAMHYKVPIVACDSSAVTETLGGAGLIVRMRNVAVVAEAIDRIVTDRKLRDTLVANGMERLADFAEDKVKSVLLKEISAFTQEI
ncbi:MAG: glycosyltransferase family 4 protein [Treponema sp.]|nr:glycosyltransferase family 4 protein [Treponema sp.]